MGSASSVLADLRKAGQLASRYPLVQELLIDVSDEELLRAGQALARLDPDQVLAVHPAQPAVSIAITGNGTLATLIPPLTAELARHSLLLRPYLAGFGSYVSDLADPGSPLYASRSQLVLCVLDPSVVTGKLPAPWSLSDLEGVMADELDVLAGLAARFSSLSGGTLVFNTVPLVRDLTAQLVDHRSRARLGRLWRNLNSGLLDLAGNHPGVVVIDLDPLIADGTAAFEPRLNIYARVGLAPALLVRYAREVSHLARYLTGQQKKVLVVDLDNTLWGGALGEDGADGIEVADTRRGHAFQSFQRVVKQLGAQGVLLAVASKNDPELVATVLTEHPRMMLRDTDFTRVMTGWQPKPESLRELAQTLNLGTASFVFVDDSAFECGAVRHELPDVAVVRLDEEPALHASKLLRDGWFDAIELTAEDRDRAVKYRAELDRRSFLDRFDSLEDYLRNLAIEVRLAAPDKAEIPRVSQLTLRTNQFNLTTRRMQPREVTAALNDPAGLVLAIHAADRFGDNGLVGAVFAHQDPTLLHIDNFLLSCRVFSRGIEQACLSVLLEHARRTGAEAVLGSYRPTAKNGLVRDFYRRSGFEQVTADEDRATFRHDLEKIPAVPEYISMTESLGRNGR